MHLIWNNDNQLWGSFSNGECFLPVTGAWGYATQPENKANSRSTEVRARHRQIPTDTVLSPEISLKPHLATTS